MLSANPKNTNPLRLGEEARKIQSALRLAKSRDQFEFATEWAVRVEDLRRAMLYHQPNIVHFSGHGAGTEGLAFEENSGITHLVSGEALASLFELFRGTVECVLLNACYSEVQAQAIHQHVDYVVGMNQPIGDVAAIEFTAGFYDALGALEGYDYAFRMGCTAIQLKGSQENLTPVIKSRQSSVSVKKAVNSDIIISEKEVREGGFFSAGNVIFQNSRRGNVQPTLYQSEREPPSLLPYLPNRSDQESEIRKALQLLLKQVPPSPLVCIIHGNEFQSHDKFLERLRKFSLPRLLGLDPNQTVIKEYCLDWPTGLKNLDELREQLCHNLAYKVLGDCSASLKDTLEDTLEDINATFCEYTNPIIIHTHLLTEDWQQQGFEILNKLLEFWQNWPDLNPGQKLIICVFIKYQTQRQKHTERFSFVRIFSYLISFCKQRTYQNINNKISAKIKVINTSSNQAFNRLSCTVLSELTNINRMHVENWVRSEQTKQFVGEEMIQKLVDEVKDIFYRWEKQTSFNTIPMDDLADELTRLLKSLNRH